MSTEQTPTNNESLSVERIPFDLEWAKRGGVISTAVNEDPALAKLLTTKSDGRVLFMFFVKHEENEKWHYGFLQKDELHFLQMATHEECEVAGVAYIEKPMSAEELAELRKDIERLWMLTELEDSVFDRIMSESESLEDLREALDVELLAMKGGA